jgi:hypothetical protein
VLSGIFALDASVEVALVPVKLDERALAREFVTSAADWLSNPSG